MELGFATSAQPSPRLAERHVYIPLNASGPSGDQRINYGLWVEIHKPAAAEKASGETPTPVIPPEGRTPKL